MPLNTKPVIIFGGAGLLLLVIILVFVLLLPGQKSPTNPSSVQGSLTMWVYGDDSSHYEPVIAAYNATYQNVKITVRTFPDYPTYSGALLNAMASGQGPDIFMIPSTELPAYLDKAVPISPSLLSPFGLEQYFPSVVSQDFVSGGYVYALPLSIDTMALLYNKDLFVKAGIVYPPATWQDFVSIVPTLTEISSTGTINQAAAAIGTSETNTDNAADLLSLLMLQTGTTMTDPKTNQATFGSSQTAADAFRFYLQFSNPQNRLYTWNSAMPDSLDAFAENKVAMIFDYASSIKELKAKNTFLNYGIAPIPEPASSTVYVASPRYAGFTVSRQSRNSSLAWNFIEFMALNPQNAGAYLKSSGNPPALLSLINSSLNDPNVSVFAKQALYARSWYGSRRDSIDGVLSQMIDAAVNGQSNINVALRQANDEVTSIMNSGY